MRKLLLLAAIVLGTVACEKDDHNVEYDVNQISAHELNGGEFSNYGVVGLNGEIQDTKDGNFLAASSAKSARSAAKTAGSDGNAYDGLNANDDEHVYNAEFTITLTGTETFEQTITVSGTQADLTDALSSVEFPYIPVGEYTITVDEEILPFSTEASGLTLTDIVVGTDSVGNNGTITVETTHTFDSPLKVTLRAAPTAAWLRIHIVDVTDYAAQPGLATVTWDYRIQDLDASPIFDVQGNSPDTFGQYLEPSDYTALYTFLANGKEYEVQLADVFADKGYFNLPAGKDVELVINVNFNEDGAGNVDLDIIVDPWDDVDETEEVTIGG